MAERGTYYVFEGIDGSGKSTQFKLFAESGRAHGRPVEVREPGSTPAGELIREVLLFGQVELTPESEVDLFTVARRELVQRIIEPNIVKGIDIVSDRNWFSTLAFQGFGRNTSVDYIISRSQSAMGDYFIPDKTVIIDVPADVARERLDPTHSAADRFERESLDFTERVIEGYHWLAKEFDIPLIDGNQPVSAVEADIRKALGF